MRAFLPALFSAAFFFAGCSPALSPEISRAVDPTLTFSMLRTDPEAHNGKIVVLCGVILETRTVGNGTELEILQKEPDYWGKPLRTDRSGGKFLARHRALLDSFLYAPGREITVGGPVTGAERGLLVIDIQETRLWEQPRPAAGDPTWMDPLSDRGVR